MAVIRAVLLNGLNHCGSGGTWAIHSSKAGLRISFRGVTIARGKDGHELVRAFHQFLEKAKAGAMR
jgi:hypothetical protein